MQQAIYIEVNAPVEWDSFTIYKPDGEQVQIPGQRGELWCPIIRLSDGLVLDWPQGATLDVCEKVRDVGQYWLLDENKQKIAIWTNYYVPEEFLCHGNKGYGDYIDFRIGADGHIKQWRTPIVVYTTIEDEDTDEKWEPLVQPTELPILPAPDLHWQHEGKEVVGYSPALVQQILLQCASLCRDIADKDEEVQNKVLSEKCAANLRALAMGIKQ